jgi:hypothetical protein
MVSIITTTGELLKTSARERIQKPTVTSEEQKENPSRKRPQYGSTRTYLRERTDPKRTEYGRRIQTDKEEKTRGQCKSQATAGDSLSRRNQMCEPL